MSNPNKKVLQGFKDLQKTLKGMATSNEELGNISVEIGLPDDRIHNPSGKTLAELGTIHEFGLHGMPERSFLRGAVMFYRSDIKDQFIRIGKEAVNGTDPMKLMDQLAIWGEGKVKEYIADGQSHFLPLASPRKDGSSNPLNDTGELRNGVIGITVRD